MTLRLSDYFRNTLEGRPGKLQSLDREIHSAELYLDIEKMRFGDRLDYSLDCGETDLQLQVPSMILQPLLENAVKHGVHRSPENTGISVQCRLRTGVFTLKVENTLHQAGGQHRPRGTGTGLKNIRERLELMYGKEGSVEVVETDSLFRVELRFPVQEEERTTKGEKR